MNATEKSAIADLQRIGASTKMAEGHVVSVSFAGVSRAPSRQELLSLRYLGHLREIVVGLA